MKIVKYISLVVICLLYACGSGNTMSDKGNNIIATIDSLNRQAFDMRYKEIDISKAAAQTALQLIEEHIPQYNDAKAQAWNHLAYACFLTSQFDDTRFYIDKIRTIEADYDNRQIEETISYITEARLFLRECKYVEAFTIYDSTITIFNGFFNKLRYNDVLPFKKYNHERYNWALSDYLIGNAVLDYYYRETELPIILSSLDRIERNKNLHIDTTQLSVLYYTYAGSYEKAIGEDVNNLYLALDYIKKGLDLMENPAMRNNYQLANLYQIISSIMTGQGTQKWLVGKDSEKIHRHFDDIKENYLVLKYGWNRESVASSELPLLLLLEADSLFRRYDDPYQNLASSLHIGNYYLLRGDKTTAWSYYTQAIEFDSIISSRGGSARIWTGRLYKTLLLNVSEQNTISQIKHWYDIYLKEDTVIAENTRMDYNAQKSKTEAETALRNIFIFACFTLVVCAVIATLLYILYRRNRQLRFIQKNLIEQKRIELLTYVVRGISHELSQPLGSITQTLYDTFSDVETLREDDIDEQYTEIVNNIYADLQTVSYSKDTISDLVNSFRNTIRENIIDPETEFNLYDKLDDILKVIRPNIKSNIDIEFNCPSDLVVKSFPLLFSQVVTNLISNANQHAFPDSDRQNDKIVIICRESSGDLIMKCIDNGIGIPENELDKLCQPFVSKKRTNLGLGLALIKNIVEQYMKGTITFSSEKGLTVTVTIPNCIVTK